MATKSKSSPSIVLNDLHDLQDMDKIKQQARQSASDLRQFAIRMSKLSHDFMDIANDELKDARRQAVVKIKADPIRATVAAFATGYLIRAIFWR